jgi:hypothetical protein
LKRNYIWGYANKKRLITTELDGYGTRKADSYLTCAVFYWLVCGSYYADKSATFVSPSPTIWLLRSSIRVILLLVRVSQPPYPNVLSRVVILLPTRELKGHR